MTIILAWVGLSFAALLGWVLGAKIHGESEYSRGFTAGQEYQKLIEKGVVEP